MGRAEPFILAQLSMEQRTIADHRKAECGDEGPGQWPGFRVRLGLQKTIGLRGKRSDIIHQPRRKRIVGRQAQIV